MVRCVDCRKLSVWQDGVIVKGKMFYVVQKQAKTSPVGFMATLKCEVRRVLRQNWKIYKERKCEYFEKRKG